MIRVDVQPAMLHWARERAGFPPEQLERRFPKLVDWESGQASPTLKQLEAFARAVYVPVGYLFLNDPPLEPVPIPDFRTVRNRRRARPSPNLLDTIYACQARQDWYRDYAMGAGELERGFVGSVSIGTPPADAAAAIRDTIHFDLEARRAAPTWTDALRQFIRQTDEAGILLMCSGVVLNNTHRGLDPEEFRGFAIADRLAPLIFVNGADTKAAQMFTLAHELGHIWLGQSALSDADPLLAEGQIEMWCDGVAAELLVPMEVLRQELHQRFDLADEVARLARRFKVSTLVVLRRMFDAEALTRARFHEEYERELERLLDRPASSGGDFYLTQPVRVSRRFAAALVESTLEGRTLYLEAFRMLGISKMETFQELGRRLLFEN